MADPKNLGINGNQNNSTNDDRVIWEDGQWAIIEAGDCWDGLARSKTRDSIGDAVQAAWDPGQTVMPGPQSIRAKKLVKVKLADLLGNVGNPTTVPNPMAPRAKFPVPANYKTPEGTPVAPPSPFTPKPWDIKGEFPGKHVPEFPHVCRTCGGRFYQGLSKSIHEETEHTNLQGACPGPKSKKGKFVFPGVQQP